MIDAKKLKPYAKPALYIGGGLLVYYYGVKPLLESIGVKKSATDKKIDDYDNAPLNRDFWRADFYKQIAPKGFDLVILKGQSFIDQMAKDIHKHLLYDYWPISASNRTKVFAEFKKLTTKAQISQLVAAYSRIYQKDLFYQLKQYLSDESLQSYTSNGFAELLPIIEKLPYGWQNSKTKVMI